MSDAARWLSLANALALESVAGSVYALSVYAPHLKLLLNLTQGEISAVASSQNLGSSSVIEAGFLFDAFGPAITGLSGAFLVALGFAGMWAVASRRVGGGVVALAIFAFTASHGSAFLDMASVGSCVRNFPADRGRVVGLTKSLYGISGALVVLLYTSLFKPDVPPFLGALAAIIGGVATFTAAGVRLVPALPPLDAVGRSKLWAATAVVAALAAYVTTAGLLQSAGIAGNNERMYALCLPLFLVSLYVVAIPTRCLSCVRGVKGRPSGGLPHDYSRDDLRALGTDIDTTRSRLLGDEAHVDVVATASDAAIQNVPVGFVALTSSGAHLPGDPEVSADELGNSARGADAPFGAIVREGTTNPTIVREGTTFLGGIATVDFLLICVTLFSGPGAGVVIINNLGSLTQSLGARELRLRWSYCRLTAYRHNSPTPSGHTQLLTHRTFTLLFFPHQTAPAVPSSVSLRTLSHIACHAPVGSHLAVLVLAQLAPC